MVGEVAKVGEVIGEVAEVVGEVIGVVGEEVGVVAEVPEVVGEVVRVVAEVSNAGVVTSSSPLKKSRPRLFQSKEWREVGHIKTGTHTISTWQINFISVVVDLA